MAIGNIVCRGGVGPTATIALFVTHGLGVGSAPPPVTVITNVPGPSDGIYDKLPYEELTLLIMLMD